jgi:F-type H+-transporting ATPase subunit b
MLDSLGINPIVTLIQAGLFGVLLVVMWRFFFARVTESLTRREREIETILREIESRRAAVEQKMKDYERRIREIEQAATLKIQEAVKEGQRIKAEFEAEAKRRADETLARGKEAIRREREQAMEHLRRESERMAAQIAERILAEPVARRVEYRP